MEGRGEDGDGCEGEGWEEMVMGVDGSGIGGHWCGGKRGGGRDGCEEEGWEEMVMGMEGREEGGDGDGCGGERRVEMVMGVEGREEGGDGDGCGGERRVEMVMGVEGREVDRVLHGRARMWVEHEEGGEDETSILALHFLSNSQIQLSDWLHYIPLTIHRQAGW